MIRQKPIKTLVSTAVVALLAHSAATHASGFSLYTEGNGSAVGNFAAGIAAEAKDASTGWYNPAGLALIKQQQAVVGGVGVLPSMEMTGQTTFQDSRFPGVNYNQTFSGLPGAKNALVPSFHYARPLSENLTAGLSVVAPFGLSTEWSEQGPIRYLATLSELKTFNVSPELGAKVNEHFAVGAGLDFQYAEVKFNRVIGNPVSGFLIDDMPTLFDSTSHNEGTSMGMGFHAGILSMFNDNHTRVGLNYQSRMRHEFNGQSTLQGPLASSGFNIFTEVPPYPSSTYVSQSLFSNTVDLPEIVTLSAYQDVNDKFALLGSIVYTGWKSLQTIQLNNVAAGTVSSLGNIVTLPLSSTSELQYRNTWRWALGANYQVNEKWMMRVGGGYDQTPTVDAYRDPRLPEMNRWALSIGSHYDFRPDVGVDVGYTYLFPDGNGTLNKTDAIGTTGSETIVATSNANASLIGAQLVWKFDYGMNSPVNG